MKIADLLFDEPASPTPTAAAETSVSESVVARFARVAATVPERIAVRDEDGATTYGDLAAESDRIGRFIHGLGLGPEARVGLMFGRNRRFVAAALGVMKAGCAYVPLDPVLPLERRRRLVDQASARLIVSEAALVGDLRSLRWRCPVVEHVLAIDTDAFDSLIEAPGSLMSGELWDHLAGDTADDVLAGGWKSPFTGEAMPADCLAAFADNARQKAQPFLRPDARVLEIGCASGFTMRAVAPGVGAYTAIDISRRNVERLEAWAVAHGLAHVSGRQMAAHDIDIFPAGSFDVILLNSVIENFPGFGYLRQVLDKAKALLAPGGAIVCGSVWDLDAKDTYLGDLADFARANAGKGYTTRLDFVEDLFVPRAFFAEWAAEAGAEATVTVMDAPGFEPAAYGYDVVLRPASEGVTAPRTRHDRRALDAQPDGPPPVTVAPDSLAYVLFTSGTTGRPKGVMIEHASVVALARSVERTLFAPVGGHVDDTSVGLNVTCLASFAFDGSVKQVFATLLCGHSVHIVGEDTKRDPARLHAFIEDRAIALVDATPSLFALLVDHWRESGATTSAGLYLLGGEAVQAELLRAFWSLPNHGAIRVVNAYGPTECCVAACQHVMTAASWQEVLPPPIGRELAHARILISDAAGRPVPDGVPGEIRIGGLGVGRGYLDDAEQTAERFVTDAGGQRWYRSGDMARRGAGGLLQFLGREDRQVKIRGNRIELTEVEAALTAHPLIRRAAVVAADVRGDGDRLLAAYVVPRGACDLAQVKRDLDASLPPYMVPSWLVAVDDIPLTPNGKIDEARLPSPAEASAPSAEAQPLTTETQRRLAVVWSEVLDLRVERADADFFMLGGHSVLAVRLLSAVDRAFGIRLPLSELFSHATLARLAERIDAGDGALDAKRILVPVKAEGSGVPLICFHPVGGNTLCYKTLADALQTNQPVYAVEAVGLAEGDPLLPTVEDMVAAYLKPIRQVIGDGPVALCGWSFGGLLAYEAAVRLQKAGVDVRSVMLFDAVAQSEPVRALLRQDEAAYLAILFSEMGIIEAADLRGLSPEARLDLMVERGRGANLLPDKTDRAGMRRLLQVFQNNALAAVRYTPPQIEGPLLLVRPRVTSPSAPGLDGDDYNGWREVAPDGVDLSWMDGTHNDMLIHPHIEELAEVVRAFMARRA